MSLGGNNNHRDKGVVGHRGKRSRHEEVFNPFRRLDDCPVTVWGGFASTRGSVAKGPKPSTAVTREQNYVDRVPEPADLRYLSE